MSNTIVRKPHSYALPILVLLAFAGLRWAYLMQLPLFVDEAIGINWTFDASLSKLYFGGLFHGRWLDTVIRVPFRPLGPETLWLSRAVTALFGVMGCASVIGAARLLHSQTAALVAGVIYVVLPYSVFFDRQVLGDPFAGVFGMIALLAALKLAQRPRVGLALLIGLALSAAVNAKFSAILLLPAPLLSALIVAPRSVRKRALLLSALAVAIAVAATLAVHVIAIPYQLPYRSIFSPEYNWNWSRVPTDFSVGATLTRWASIGAELLDEMSHLLTWPLIALAAFSLVVAARRRSTRAIAWLWLVGVGHFIPFVLITTWLPARYLSTITMPLTIIAGIAAVEVIRWADAIHVSPALRASVRLALGALILIPAALTSSRLMVNPADPALLPAPDYASYFTNPDSAGTGLEAVGAALRAYAAEHGYPVHLIHADTSSMKLRPYWGGTAGYFLPYEDSPDQQRLVARWLLAGENVVFVDRGSLPDAPYAASVETIASAAAAAGPPYRVRAVTGPLPEMLRIMFEEAFGHPDAIAGDYAQIPAALGERTEAVIVYPPHQLEPVEQALAGSGLDVLAVGSEWPLDVEHARQQINAAASRYRYLSFVYWNETAGDPSRLLETWLLQTVYPLREQWVGPLRMVEYVSASDAPAPEAIGSRFGDQIVLDSARVSQLAGVPDVVLVALHWRAASPIAGSYAVATFVLGEDGSVLTQRDSLPMSALAPTNTWAPDQIVVDQFALRLPPDTPPGTYDVRVTLYDPATLARLPVSGGDAVNDLLRIGTVTIPEE